MLKLHRHSLVAAALAVIACLLLYAGAGQAKPFNAWRWMDIVAEGGMAAMAGLWFVMTLSSRPGGLVTRLLSGGLAAIMLGSWADCLDEFFRIDKAASWDNWLEALVPFGMLVLTAGIYYWRHEQFMLNDHLAKRERLFRQHRAFDRVTQLADAAYMRHQIRLEQERDPSGQCALVLLDIDGFHRINREHGAREGDRVLQAVGHMLLLNLRNEDLLCRYAGDRFALLLPGMKDDQARALAQHLCSMVAAMRHHGPQGPLPVSLRFASDAAQGDADCLLARLSAAVDGAGEVLLPRSQAAYAS
ncbi:MULTISPECIES: GGDEF domain-containing protein [unclassified Duganella]|uniref:GGDEF domain-containing protein n=1 Tax=unclassified Duganella TaxID=2636909 RepID=UPI0006F4E386|nr:MULTISPECIES: GGDEF domain-containing protein [unclassified Duganella]KQV61394.1 diguanylate cyclase [Duganella sp. Root336D2]KRB92515.1 diguanylate cyclase [Duganella sp. Root198D2]